MAPTGGSSTSISSVNEGEAFGFLGPNGAGKTTTIRTLLDHIRPTSGRATIFGIVTTEDPVAIHRRLGYLPGEFTLYDKLTGGQTIEYFANLRGGVDPGYQADLIARLDIDPSRKFREYSKGNKQKVGLVIALQHRPDLLMLDEPTSGLDPLVQQEFYTLIREAKAEGRTVFMSSHILSEVEKTCDRVAIIRDGRLVRVDRVEALRDMAHHPVELRFVERRASGGIRIPARRQRRQGRGPRSPHARLGRDHSGRPCRSTSRAGRLREPRAVARRDLPGRVREPAAGRGGAVMTAPATQASRPSPLSRAFGLGSVFGKTLRDSRRSTIIVGLAVGLLILAVSAGIVSQFGTAEARDEIGNIVDAVPPIMQGLAGKPVNVETLGGYLQYKYGGFLPLVIGLWSILALSGTLAAETRRGSLDILLAAPISRRRVAWEKVLGHVLMVALAMTIIGTATAIAGQQLRQRSPATPSPSEPPSASPLWLGLMALAAGSRGLRPRTVRRTRLGSGHRRRRSCSRASCSTGTRPRSRSWRRSRT